MEHLLEESLSQVIHEVAHSGKFEPRILSKAIRTFLENSQGSINSERVVAWCQKAFLCEFPLEDIILLVWQVFYRYAPRDAEKFPCGDTVWMQLGKHRGRIIYDQVADERQFGETAVILLKFITDGGLGTLLVANIIEVAERLLQSIKFENQLNLMGDTLLRLIGEVITGKDELVLNKMKSLVLTFYNVLKNFKSPDLRSRLDYLVDEIDKDSKIRYILLRELLSEDIEVAGFTDPSSLSFLLNIIVESKALAPSVAECVVLFVTNKSHDLCSEIEYFFRNDFFGYLGIFLYPRLVKRATDHAINLLKFLESLGKTKCDDMIIQQYCSLFLAILEGEHMKSCNVELDMDLVSKGLVGHSETLRMRSFMCLCRSNSMEVPYSEGVANKVVSFLNDMLLIATSDSRQITISALKYLCDIQISRLYKLFRDMGKLHGKDGSELDKEIVKIKLFWVEIIDLSISSMVTSGFYNKNDLCLRTLKCIVDVWQQKLLKFENMPVIRERLFQLFKEMIEKMNNDQFQADMCERALRNSFDLVRESSVDLLRSLHHISHDSFLANEKDYISSNLIPLLTQRRTHLIDGACKLLNLACEIQNSHQGTIIQLLNLLEKDVKKIVPSDPDTFSNSSALGLMSGLRYLMNHADQEQSRTVISICHKLGTYVINHVSHPSPEGLSLEGSMESLGLSDAEDDNDIEAERPDNAFSIMTFCWRSVKEMSALLAASLKTLTKTKADYELMETNGKYLIEMLLKVRHPGAFVALAKPLCDICQCCFNSDNDLCHIPAKLLQFALELCIMQPEVQTTRRSAGLPFCIGSIVIASRDTLRRVTLLRHAFDTLFHTLNETEFILTNPGPRVVHTLNIFRRLFRDANLADDITQFIPRGFLLCFKSFGSPSWSVRNSGMMLFTSIMNRTFGIRHEIDDFAPSNLLDCRTIHAKNEMILDIIIFECDKSCKLLKGTVDTSRYEIEFAVYPLLAFIQRVRFSSGGERKHFDFYKIALELCFLCLANDIMKVRRMAVRLLIHMCESPSLKLIMENRVKEMLMEGLWSRVNELHGYLILLEVADWIDNDGSILKRCREIVQKRSIKCYFIDSLLNKDQGSCILNLVDSKDLEIDKCRENILIRNLSEGEAFKIMPILFEHAISTNSSEIFEIFESFWLEYDLSGIYRRAIVHSWRPCNVQAAATDRIRYLALTDNDEDIRLIASSAKFGEPSGSVAYVLRSILQNNPQGIRDLIEWLPEDTTQMDSSRKQLFEPEPLNSFKDPKWEIQFLN